MVVRFAVTKLATAVVLLLFALPLASDAQPPAKAVRIGVLTVGLARATPPFEAFLRGLQENGYVEGQNMVLEFRFAEGRIDRLAALASELVRLQVDVIVTEGNAAALAAKQATQTIPIVMAVASDPVKAGVVASLARPGGNVTGLTLIVPELSAKRLELLREALPRMTLVAVMWNPSNPASADYVRVTEAAARSLGVQVQAIAVRSPAELDDALKTVANLRPNALITISDGMLASVRTRIVDFAMKSRLPGIFPDREFAELGGLMSYSPNPADITRRAALLVDKVLKGAKPADLPIEQPTKLDLVINLKTAKTLGLTIPPSLLLRADRLIE
jgi:putative tryptophan/tyrosine transport system substrate-binding protein